MALEHDNEQGLLLLSKIVHKEQGRGSISAER